MSAKNVAFDQACYALVAQPRHVDDDASEDEGDDKDREQRFFVDDSFHIVDSIKVAAAAATAAAAVTDTDNYELSSAFMTEIPLQLRHGLDF